MSVSFWLKMKFSRVPHCTTGLLEAFLPKANNVEGDSPSAGAVSGFENQTLNREFVLLLSLLAIVVLFCSLWEVHMLTSTHPAASRRFFLFHKWTPSHKAVARGSNGLPRIWRHSVLCWGKSESYDGILIFSFARCWNYLSELLLLLLEEELVLSSGLMSWCKLPGRSLFSQVLTWGWRECSWQPCFAATSLSPDWCR